MSINRWSKWCTAGAMALTVACGSAMAQETKPKNPQAPRNPAQRPNAGPAGQLDSHIAECLILDNQNEIALAQIAQRRGEGQDVKEFAERLQSDHREFLTQLEKYAQNDFKDRGTEGRTANRRDANDPAQAKPRTGDRPDATPDRAQPQNRPQSASRAGEPAGAGRPDAGGSTAQLLQIKHEIADECLASAQAELEEKQGKEFDACWLGMQIAAHMHMVDSLKVLERHTDSEFQSVIRKGRETAQKHLDQAKRLMKDNDERTARADK